MAVNIIKQLIRKTWYKYWFKKKKLSQKLQINEEPHLYLLMKI